LGAGDVAKSARPGVQRHRALAIERISLVRQNDANTPFRVIEQATLRPAR
jgi:hypothetical protein